MRTPNPLTSAVLVAAFLAVPALASGADASSASLSPICFSKTGSVLFFLEQNSVCEGSQSRCRRSRWAYAALKVPGDVWEFEPLGDASLDEAAAPESNAQASRQLFRAPQSQACASFFRALRLPSPDLPDSEAWFGYTLENGTLRLHWQGQSTEVSPDVRIWKLGWCTKNCGTAGEGPRAEPLAALKKADAKKKEGAPAPALMVPTVDLPLGSDVLLGFPEPRGAGSTDAFLMVRVAQARLHTLQAQLLHKDAKGLLQKASGDLFASARAAGLLDAALQFDPSNREARLDYVRLLAGQGEPKAAVRELEQLRGEAGLRGRLETDKALDPVRGNEQFKKFVESLPK